MPDLVLKGTGRRVFVPDEGLSDALASNLYEQIGADQGVTVTMDGPVPLAAKVSASDLDRAATTAGADLEAESSFRARERSARIEREHGGVIGGLATGVETVLDEATLGGFGALGEVLGGQDYTERRLERQEARPIIHGVAKVGTIAGTTLLSGGVGTAGKLARATPLGAATAAGSRVAARGGVARVAAGGMFEGGVTGFGQGVQEVVASDDDLTVERLASTLGSNTLAGVATGGAANVAVHGAGKALRAAQKQLAKAGQKAEAVSDDLARLDSKQLAGLKREEIAKIDAERTATKAELAAARKAETEAIDTGIKTRRADLTAARKAELDAIEADRVAQRATVADELAAFRKQTKEQKLWLATKDVKDVEGLGAVGKRTLKADRALDRLLDNPKALAARPQRALDALQQQESALDDIVRNREALLERYASDTSGTRQAALEAAEAALERNRALQRRLADLSAPPSSQKLAALDDEIAAAATPSRSSAKLDEIQAALDDLATRGRTSTRLDEIQAAQDALGGGKSFGEQMTQGAVFSGVTGAVASLPIPGAALAAPIIGGKVAGFVTEKLFGALGKSAGQAAARTAKAIDTFLDVARPAAHAAPVLATKALGSVSYAPPDERKPRRGVPVKEASLAEVYRVRADELKAQVVYQAGVPKLRREARARIAEQLRPVAMVDPLLADRLETMQARKLEFLARKLPRRPDVAGIQAGPDRWQPSDFEMRGFARYAAAAEDPGAIEERLAEGTVTPEDAEVMREVYPERLADLTRQILERLPELQETLPYERRLALSILTGVPVDPAMDPRILRTLQASFAAEPGTEGGTQAPKPMPQFGSVRNQEPTASQRRQGVTQ